MSTYTLLFSAVNDGFDVLLDTKITGQDGTQTNPYVIS